jgi:HD superfamily phosphohydrolase YqeK
VRLKHCIDNSETARDKAGMVDLDTGDQYQAVLKVFDFAKRAE